MREPEKLPLDSMFFFCKESLLGILIDSKISFSTFYMWTETVLS